MSKQNKKTRSELVVFMNNLLSYFGLVDPRISASEKDLPVKIVSILATFLRILWSSLFCSQNLQNNFNLARRVKIRNDHNCNHVYNMYGQWI